MVRASPEPWLIDPATETEIAEAVILVGATQPSDCEQAMKANRGCVDNINGSAVEETTAMEMLWWAGTIGNPFDVVALQAFRLRDEQNAFTYL
jgi:hypothetical protein